MPVIGLALHLVNAWPRTLLDMKQQARPTEAFMLMELHRRTGAHRKRSQQCIERVTNRPSMGIGPEILCAFSLAPTHHHCPRPLFIQRDGQKRITLVISQTHVEPWAVLLDEVVLQHQGCNFAVYLDPHHFCRSINHCCSACVQQCGVNEVARHSRTQIRSFADIDDSPKLVFELIRARTSR